MRSVTSWCATFAFLLAAPAVFGQESAPPKAETSPPDEPAQVPVKEEKEQTDPVPLKTEGVPVQGEFAVVPFGFPTYSPETSVMVGGAAMFVYRFPEGSGRRDSQVLTALAASVKGQVTFLVQPDIYLWNDNIQIGATLAASRFPNSFYGIGNSPDGKKEEKYTPVTFEAALSPKLRLVEGLYLGPEVRFQYANITDKESGGLLQSGAVRGSDGGNIVQLGASGFYDARDNTIYPHRGHIVRVNARTALTGLGSDFSYRSLTVDARKYFPMPWEKHVLAMQALFEVRDGEPPFYDLGQLGGDATMRGYFQGKFRDRNYVTAQVEYRMPLFWRLGAVGFVSAGQVARTLDDMRFSDIKVGAGGGLRLAPFKDVPVNIRVDIAYGDEPNFYVNIGEAF
ncbi:outer membrane protein assembly factor [Pendulispora rubella]|uniref:Outer membrane protein assembly factor n=1 Tax=Pendulispora rubella TaxID=2741070 RepID=A0ABZ2KQJ2_9BACT